MNFLKDLNLGDLPYYRKGKGKSIMENKNCCMRAYADGLEITIGEKTIFLPIINDQLHGKINIDEDFISFFNGKIHGKASFSNFPFDFENGSFKFDEDDNKKKSN